VRQAFIDSATAPATVNGKLSGTDNYVGSWEDIDRLTFLNVTAPGYTTVNIAANYAATDRLMLFERIDNLCQSLPRPHQRPLRGREARGSSASAGELTFARTVLGKARPKGGTPC
jgi:hypothetical protein